MANTVIQIKRSTVTTAPTAGSLSVAEQAYSYLSDKLFIGSSDGSQVIEIGGRYYVNIATQAYNLANTANVTAIAAFDQANLAFAGAGATSAAFDKANSANIIASGAFEKANSANLLAFNTGIGANAWANSVGIAAGAASNAWANTVSVAAGVASNAWANSVGVTVAASSNAWANTVGVATGAASNAWANSVGVAAGAASNAWANTVSAAAGIGANNFANGSFVKLVAGNQTITGNIAITGSITVAGNAFSIDTETLRVSDPLIYLAGNNYTSDIVDIGFVGNYVNATGSNVHTGVFRDATVKEYYIFDSYDKEPIPNHIDTAGNNFTLAVLNATIRTSNLILGGANAITTINNIGLASNAWANSVGVAANSFASLAFNKANSAVQTGFVTISAGGTSLVADSNNDTLSITSANGVTIVGDAGTDSMVLGLSPTGVTATSYGGAASVGTFVVNEWGRITSAGNAAIAIDAAAITSGILSVPRGGTGASTFANNGILFGNITGAVRVTAAGTEGNVLQVNNQGTPLFGMLDGGTF
jgi:hypothetical protein